MKTFWIRFEDGEGAEVQAESPEVARKAAQDVHESRVVSIVQIESEDDEDDGEDEDGEGS